MADVTAAPQPWRVVTPAGDVHAALVVALPRAVGPAVPQLWRATPAEPEAAPLSTRPADGDSPREAVTWLATLRGWEVAEVLGPGELTAQEREAAAYRRGRESMRAEAMQACLLNGTLDGEDYARRVRALPVDG